jgi:hypothetical protein
METDPAEDVVKQMWDFGNLITAFTVAQSLTVIYFSLEKVNIVREWLSYAWIAVFLILAGTAVYGSAIWACYRAERRLRLLLDHPSLVLDTSFLVVRGRLATVTMFNCMAASATIFAILRC